MEDNQHKYYIRELAEKWAKGIISEEERAYLESWYASFKDEEVTLPFSKYENADAMQQAILSGIYREIDKQSDKEVKVRRIRRLLYRITAAASVLLLLTAGGYFLLQKNSLQNKSSRLLAEKQIQDIVPGGNNAVLTLSNGSKVILNSINNGSFATQGNSKITKVNSGLLAYKAESKEPNAKSPLRYNILTTPRGGQYQLVLADGTKVWLNAASSIRYPVSFTGTSRTVEITGEAYFEVVHNAKMPFIVKAGNTFIHDVGTHFNVNAYNNEPSMKITLLEGAVQIEQSDTKAKQLMHPGEQISIDKQGSFSLDLHADIDGAIAWKEGLFDFNGENLATAMRQISRWYDVEVDYPDGIPDILFTGAIHRNANISRVLDMLSYFNIRFKIVQYGDRKKIIVTL
jgi:ferric-dicitrate binding protein FerR (iron transport regulator)